MKIDENILKIIESGIIDGNLYYLPKIQLDRKTYVAVNKVLELLGGGWNKKQKVHIFSTSIEDAIDNVLLTGEVVDIKKELQFFETPLELAKRLVEMAEVKDGMRCLEPSAGKGRIAEALADKISKDCIRCCDIKEEFVDILVNKGFKACCYNFLGIGASKEYNRVVMNPPFTKQQDIDHVLHALDFLKDDGILVSVMSAGVMSRTNKKTENFWKEIHKYKFEVEYLPKGTFKSSGTMVNTMVLKVRKE